MRPPSSSPPRHRDDGGDDSNRDDFSLTRPPQHDAQSSPRLLLSAVAAAASPTRLPPSRQPPPQHHAHYQSPSSSSSSSSPSPPPPAPTLPLQGPPPPAAAIVGLARHDADTHAHSFDASLPLSDSAPACPPDSRTRRRPRSGPPPSATRPSSGTQELSPSVDQAEFDPDPEPAAAADDADGDDGRPSGGNPAHHHLQSLSVSSDHDLLMSDSDGGAPLADLAVATSFFSSIDLGLNPDSDGVAADPQDSDSDSDADPDHNNAQASAANAPADSSNSSSHHAYTLSQPGHLAEIHAYHASLLHLVMADAPPPPPPWANNSQPPPLVQAGNAPPAFAPQLPFFDAFDAFPPVQMSNPNPTILGSENLGLVDFLRNWAYQACFGSAPGLRPPLLPEVHSQARAEVKDVTYADLAGDARDFQALDWSAMATTREAARARRLGTYKNYVNHLRSDESQTDDVRIPSSDSFFRFRKMTFRPDISLAHFQLRSVLACPTRTEAYYSCLGGVRRLSLASRRTELALNLHELPALGGPISTLDAAHGLLMGGTFHGNYCLHSLDSDDGKAFSEGHISHEAITNHLRIHTSRRSGRPVASIASNDRGFRVLDLETEQFLSQDMYGFALNCSALSPDRRLRVLVGDDPTVLIVNADTGETLQRLAGHRDYGFACDWSDDGRTVATGFQDKAVKIWDARRWCDSSGKSTPLCTIRSEMAGVRGLRFSPLGSGRPVLAAAEEADFVNLIDARTFAAKQTMDVFGEIGGVAFADDGHDLHVLCCDAHRGGLLQLERCGAEPGPGWRPAARPPRRLFGGGGDDGAPWHGGSSRRPTFLQGPEPF